MARPGAVSYWCAAEITAMSIPALYSCPVGIDFVAWRKGCGAGKSTGITASWLCRQE